MPHGECVVEVRHQRAFTTLPVRSAEVELVVETPGGALDRPAPVP